MLSHRGPWVNKEDARWFLRLKKCRNKRRGKTLTTSGRVGRVLYLFRLPGSEPAIHSVSCYWHNQQKSLRRLAHGLPASCRLHRSPAALVPAPRIVGGQPESCDA